MLLVGCTSAKTCPQHPWNNNLPKGTDYSKYYDNPIKRELWFEVGPQNLIIASKILSNMPFKLLNEDEIKALLPEDKMVKQRGKYFLIRGLREDPESGRIDVYMSNNDLLVAATIIGHIKNVIETPIIVLLDKAPDNLYVICFGAQ